MEVKGQLAVDIESLPGLKMNRIRREIAKRALESQESQVRQLKGHIDNNNNNENNNNDNYSRGEIHSIHAKGSKGSKSSKISKRFESGFSKIMAAIAGAGRSGDNNNREYGDNQKIQDIDIQGNNMHGSLSLYSSLSESEIDEVDIKQCTIAQLRTALKACKISVSALITRKTDLQTLLIETIDSHMSGSDTGTGTDTGTDTGTGTDTVDPNPIDNNPNNSNNSSVKKRDNNNNNNNNSNDEKGKASQASGTVKNSKNSNISNKSNKSKKSNKRRVGRPSLSSTEQTPGKFPYPISFPEVGQISAQQAKQLVEGREVIGSDGLKRVQESTQVRNGT